jgi:hypothetical protein
MTGHGQPTKFTSQTPQIHIPISHSAIIAIVKNSTLPSPITRILHPKRLDGRKKPVEGGETLMRKRGTRAPPIAHMQDQWAWEDMVYVGTDFDLPLDPCVTNVTVTNCIVSTKEGSAESSIHQIKSKKRKVEMDPNSMALAYAKFSNNKFPLSGLTD